MMLFLCKLYFNIIINTMKSLHLILQRIYIILLLGMTIGCSNNVKEQTSKEILNDTQKQKEIMNMISNNHEMMSNFMKHMIKSEHAMQMMMATK